MVSSISALSKSNRTSTLSVLTPSGAKVALRRDLRSWYVYSIAKSPHLTLPAKQFQVGEVWLPTERHSLTQSSTFGKTSSSSNLAHGGLFAGAHGNLAEISKPSFSSSPDMTLVMLGFSEYDVTKKANRMDLWGRSAFSMGTNAGNHVFGSTLSADLDFICPERWFGIQAEAIKATLEFSEGVNRALEPDALGAPTFASFVFRFSSLLLRARFSLRLGHASLTCVLLKNLGVDSSILVEVAGIVSQTRFLG